MNAKALRRAQLDDAEEVARLAAELGYQASGEQMRARLERLCADATQFVAVASAGPRRLLGWIHASRTLVLESGEAVEIVGLIVDSSARRSAVGRTLVQAAEQWAGALGVGCAIVRSNALRAEAHTFYPVLGYQRSKTQHVYRKALVG